LGAFALELIILYAGDYHDVHLAVIRGGWKEVALHEAEVVDTMRADDVKRVAAAAAENDCELNELRPLDEALGMGVVGAAVANETPLIDVKLEGPAVESEYAQDGVIDPKADSVGLRAAVNPVL